MDISTLLTGRNALLPVGVYAVTQALKMALPKVFQSSIGQRFVPIIPLVLGIALAMAGLGEGATRWQDRMLMGLIAGFTASHLFKLGKTSLLGWGIESTQEEPPAVAAGSAPAAPAEKKPE